MGWGSKIWDPKKTPGSGSRNQKSTNPESISATLMLTKQIFFLLLLRIVRSRYRCNTGTITRYRTLRRRSRLSVSMLIRIGMFLNPKGVTCTCFFSYLILHLHCEDEHSSFWISAFIIYNSFSYRNCWTRWKRRERWSARLAEKQSQAEK
jgi:hypothetical protein